MRRPWIALVALTAACGTGGNAADPASASLPTVVPTVPGVGSLPDTIPAERPQSGGAGGVLEPLVVITRPVSADGVIAEHIGELVGGNRLLMIGDSIFAGTESRYGGEMCTGLNPLGWTVEVAAEAGRFVEFGVTVAEREILASPEPGADVAEQSDDDWDAVAVFLGSNYNGNKEYFDTKMREILDRAASRPILLYSVTEYRTNYSEVGEVIDQLVKDYENVTLIDWARAAKTPGVLRADGLHPNDAGEQVLVDLTGAALGRAPDGEATCIRSQYNDDSAISQGNGTPNTGGSSSSSSSSSGGSSSTGGSSSGSTSGSGTSSTGGTSTGSTSGGGTTTTLPGTDGGSSDDGSATDGSATDGSATDGSATDGSATDGSATDGSATDGSATDGSATDGSATDGSATDGSATDGSATDGSATDGSATDGSATDGSATDGSATDGSATDGSTTDGSTTDGSTTDGSTTDGSTTDP